MLLSLLIVLLFVGSHGSSEERVATNQPTFISKGGDIRVKEGSQLELECAVSDLGEFVLLWKFNKTQVLFAGNLRIHRDDRIARNDSTGSLTVTDFRAENAGEYSCQVSTNPPQDIVYSVHALGPPLIQENNPPKDVTVRRGQALNLFCDARDAQFEWRRGTRVLSKSNTLQMAVVEREDAGIYTCIASNELGQASRETRVRVLYEPTIEVPIKVVHAPIGQSVVVVCLVRAEPSANIDWLRGSNQKVLPSERVIVDRNDTTAILKISSVVKEDYDVYSCLANNSIGSASKQIQVSGKPSQPTFTSTPLAGQHKSYLLQWKVESESPITKYVIRWKPRDDQQWQQTTVTPEADDDEKRVLRTFQFEVTSLETDRNYDAEVRAHNRFGETVSDVFAFVTSLSHVSSPSAFVALFLALSVQSFQ